MREDCIPAGGANCLNRERAGGVVMTPTIHSDSAPGRGSKAQPIPPGYNPKASHKNGEPTHLEQGMAGHDTQEPL